MDKLISGLERLRSRLLSARLKAQDGRDGPCYARLLRLLGRLIQVQTRDNIGPALCTSKRDLAYVREYEPRDN